MNLNELVAWMVNMTSITYVRQPKWKNLYIFQVVPWLSPVIFRRCLFQPLVFFLANHCQKSWCFKKYTNPLPGACFWTLNRNPDFVHTAQFSWDDTTWFHLETSKFYLKKLLVKDWFFWGITKGTLGNSTIFKAIWCGSTTPGLWCQVALNQDE